MSLEVKTFDIAPCEEQTLLNIMYSFGWTLKSSQRIFNRSTRPTSAFTFEGTTFIHSETETDEFTSLTFERETNIPHYRKIVKLEDEFWELLPYMSEKKPLPPPPKMSFQQWLQANKPRVLSLQERIIPLLIFLIIFTTIFFVSLNEAFLSAGFTDYDAEEKHVTCMIAFGIAIPLSLIINAILSKVRNAAALKNPRSKGYAIAHRQYVSYEENHAAREKAPAMYDHAQLRVREIVAQSKYLLDEK